MVRIFNAIFLSDLDLWQTRQCTIDAIRLVAFNLTP